MADKRDNSVHVRLSDDADATTELLAQVQGISKTEVITKLVHRALLGEGHDIKVAALRFARLGLTGNGREGAG